MPTPQPALNSTDPAPSVNYQTDRDQRSGQAHVGSWNISASYSGAYKGFGAQVDLYAFAVVDNAICSYHMGLPAEAGRALYEALGKVLYPATPLLSADPFEGTIDAFLADVEDVS